jgi:asparagine synthase (glutamine-hydrolysing)
VFLIAITKSSVIHNPDSNFKEFRLDPFFVTIATDSFLSKSIIDSTGFTIIESPPEEKNGSQAVFLSKVTYKKENNTFEIYKPAISGRPVYYHLNSKGEFFCSTHISMLRKTGVTIEENKEALPEFFIYRYVYPPTTLYKNIYQLNPETKMQIALVDGKCKIESVNQYIPSGQKSDKYTKENIDAEVLNYFRIAIDSLNTRKEKIAIQLSGGLDSSILFKLCQIHYNVDTSYSVGIPFTDPQKNIERMYAVSAAKAFGANHNYYEVNTTDYLRGLLQSVSAAEEPLKDLHSVAFYLLFKKCIPKSNIIVINGQGAEGIWGLNQMYNIYKNMNWPRKVLSTYPTLNLLRIASQISGRRESTIKFLNTISDIRSQGNNHFKPDELIRTIGNFGDENWVCNYFKVTKNDILQNRLNAIKPFLNRSIYDILGLFDVFGDGSITQYSWAKLGESQHRILYYPFNDIKLLDYAYSIPWEMKLKKPKNILRGVARQLQVPEFIITRQKSGFGIHSWNWADRGGIFEPLIPLASKVFDEKQIRAMQSGNLNKAMTFWCMLNYSIWKRLCVNNEPIDVLLDQLS